MLAIAHKPAMPALALPFTSRILMVAALAVAVPSSSPAHLPVNTAAPATSTPSLAGDWQDWPVTPGTWVYRQDARGSIALFGMPGSDAEVTLRCDRAARALYLSRKGTTPGNVPLTLRTTSTTRILPVQPTGGTPAYMAVGLTPGDPLLDAMIYSRGRFVLEEAGLPTLVVPAWAEIARVTEDCRRL